MKDLQTTTLPSIHTIYNFTLPNSCYLATIKTDSNTTETKSTIINNHSDTNSDLINRLNTASRHYDLHFELLKSIYEKFSSETFEINNQKNNFDLNPAMSFRLLIIAKNKFNKICKQERNRQIKIFICKNTSELTETTLNVLNWKSITSKMKKWEHRNISKKTVLNEKDNSFEEDFLLGEKTF